MKKNLRLIFLIPLLSLSSLAISKNCPPPSLFHQSPLIQAFSNPSDPDVWHFLSMPFVFEGNTWNVDFGTFLFGVKTREAALKQGQAYFNQVDIKIQDPLAVDIPGYTLCNYMPNGDLYWISALTPPER